MGTSHDDAEQTRDDKCPLRNAGRWRKRLSQILKLYWCTLRYLFEKGIFPETSLSLSSYIPSNYIPTWDSIPSSFAD